MLSIADLRAAFIVTGKLAYVTTGQASGFMSLSCKLGPPD